MALRTIFFVFTTTAFFSCGSNIDTEYIKTKIWEHERGFSIGEGDFVIFKTDQNLFEIKKDTIYYSGKPRALIKSLDKKNFTLRITSVNGKEIGIYRNQEESLNH